LVDFSNIAPGEKIILENIDPTANDAKQTLGQIMQFTVTDKKGVSPQSLPSELNPTLSGNFPSLPVPTKTRTLTLVEQAVPETLAMLLDGQRWSAPVSEEPQLGATEDWMIVNPTMNSHPIHLHLVQFQLVERRRFDSNEYFTDWTALNGDLPLNHSTINVASLDRYLIGDPIKPTFSEQGWKDTIQADAGMITVIRVRFAPQDGSDYKFDPIVGSGYVWHCHILDHEDNEMMRPLMLVAATSQTGSLLFVIAGTVVAVVALVFGWVVFKRIWNRSVKK
jgi:FtsP/CotA-like multicopper oxidase with cupredoxin domain